MKTKPRVLSWVIAAFVVSWSAGPHATQEAESLGSVQLPRNVLADGSALPAGTYTVRLSSEPVAHVVGLSDDSSRWVEFVQGGQVRGRELATVVPPEEVETVAKAAPPAPGTARVQFLRGSEYLRVWLNRAGTQYLVHLGVSAN